MFFWENLEVILGKKRLDFRGVKNGRSGGEILG